MSRLHERQWTHDRSHREFYGESTSIAYTRNSWDTPGAPWHDEPDKAQWVDAETGYACLAVRNRSGAWCGYVGLPPGHRYHGTDYDNVPVYVHGGLTYASFCQEDAEEGHGICHIPEPGAPDAVWWLGFDCAHLGDLCPQAPVYGRDFPGAPRETYRTLAYVQEECHQLAGQLAARGPRMEESP